MKLQVRRWLGCVISFLCIGPASKVHGLVLVGIVDESVGVWLV